MPEMPKQTEEKLEQLQLMEQNLRTSMVQRQNFQSQLLEIESALSQIETSDRTFKIIGSIMVAKDKKNLKEELEKKKEILGIRIKALEKQEQKIKEKAEQTQKEVLKEMNKGEKE